MWFMQQSLTMQDILMRILSVLVIIFLVLPFHEWAHGYVAYKLGDPTAKNSGRLTFNPIASIDPLGSLGILLFGIGWAKPVPVNPSYFRKPKRDMAITAFAGPLSNILAALLGGLLLNATVLVYSTTHADYLAWVVTFFNFYMYINIGLAIFNLLPVPPLDGSRLVAAFLPDSLVEKYYRYQQIFVLVIFALLFLGFLSFPIFWAQTRLYSSIIWLTSLPFAPFL